MTDAAGVVHADVYEEYHHAIAEVKERIAMFSVAVEQVAVEPITNEVVAQFDTDGFLTDLYISPAARRRYTNVEGEQLITEVLQGTERQMSEAVRALIDQYGLNDILAGPLG